MHAASPVTALYFPATHSIHSPPFDPVYPGTHSHAEPAVCPVANVTEFARQAVHVVSKKASTAAEYLLTPQSVHGAVSVYCLYFPAEHVVHGPPFGPVHPLLHQQSPIHVFPLFQVPMLDGQLMHVVSAVAPTAVEYLLSAHSVHAAAPMTALNFPAKHATHVPPFGPVDPMLQRQLPITVFPAPVVPELDGQLWHLVSAIAPISAEYLLTAQSVHGASPVTPLYFPATQAIHAPPFGPVYP
jgi:hypothetical protein